MTDPGRFPHPGEWPENGDERSLFHCLFTPDETCPYGDAAFMAIEKCVTVYREETIHEEVPDEVHFRLHRVIRQQWTMYYRSGEGPEE